MARAVVDVRPTILLAAPEGADTDAFAKRLTDGGRADVVVIANRERALDAARLRVYWAAIWIDVDALGPSDAALLAHVVREHDPYVFITAIVTTPTSRCSNALFRESARLVARPADDATIALFLQHAQMTAQVYAHADNVLQGNAKSWGMTPADVEVLDQGGLGRSPDVLAPRLGMTPAEFEEEFRGAMAKMRVLTLRELYVKLLWAETTGRA